MFVWLDGVLLSLVVVGGGSSSSLTVVQCGMDVDAVQPPPSPHTHTHTHVFCQVHVRQGSPEWVLVPVPGTPEVSDTQRVLVHLPGVTEVRYCNTAPEVVVGEGACGVSVSSLSLAPPVPCSPPLSLPPPVGLSFPVCTDLWLSKGPC